MCHHPRPSKGATTSAKGAVQFHWTSSTCGGSLHPRIPEAGVRLHNEPRTTRYSGAEHIRRSLPSVLYDQGRLFDIPSTLWQTAESEESIRLALHFPYEE